MDGRKTLKKSNSRAGSRKTWKISILYLMTIPTLKLYGQQERCRLLTTHLRSIHSCCCLTYYRRLKWRNMNLICLKLVAISGNCHCILEEGKKEMQMDTYLSTWQLQNTLPLGWEMNVKFNIFVYDQLRDKYLTFQGVSLFAQYIDGNGGVVRFHGMKTEHGFAQLVSLENFNNASNGYLVDDSCIFGTEIFVIKSTGNGECVSVVKTDDDNFHSWKLEKFSALNTKRCWSEEFTSAGQKWKLAVYPKGCSSQIGEYLCLGINLADSVSLLPERLLYAEYRLRIRDQIRGQHEEITDASWFSNSIKCLYKEFLSLSALHDPSRGFLVNDTLIVEGQIKFATAVKRFS